MTTVLDPRHTVYSVKGVTAIPLEEDRARTVISALASRNKVDRRVSLLPTEAAEREYAAEDAVTAASIDESGADETKSPRVKFADEHEVKVVSPRPDQGFNISEDDGPPSPSSSIASSVQSNNTDTVVKTLAERLSFWTRLSKRNSRQSATIDHVLVEQSDVPGQPPINPVDLESIVKDESKDREEVIETIVAAAAPPPPTIEEKHSELEEKIVRECIREFTRGGMYFAYAFGKCRLMMTSSGTY